MLSSAELTKALSKAAGVSPVNFLPAESILSDVKFVPAGAYYEFPVLPDFPGFKVAKHWHGNPTDPDKVDRAPNAADEQFVRNYLERHLPSTNGSLLAFKVCMHTHGGPWLGPLPVRKHTFPAQGHAAAAG